MTDKGKMIEAVYKANLTKRATLVVFYLINRVDKELTCFPGIKTIAKECNMSIRTVQRALNDLVESGFLKKESRFHEQGGQRSNFYTLMITEPKVENKHEEMITFEGYVIKDIDMDNDLTNGEKVISEKSDSQIQKVICNLNIGKIVMLKRVDMKDNYSTNLFCRGG